MYQNSLVVAVTGNNVGELQGATVTLTGKEMSKVEETNADGEALFAFIPPGVYEIKGEMAGYNPATQRVEVPLNAHTTLANLNLQPAVSE